MLVLIIVLLNAFICWYVFQRFCNDRFLLILNVINFIFWLIFILTIWKKNAIISSSWTKNLLSDLKKPTASSFTEHFITFIPTGKMKMGIYISPLSITFSYKKTKYYWCYIQFVIVVGFNVDINGSYNIMRKDIKKVSLDDKVTYPECRGFVYNPDKFNLKWGYCIYQNYLI